MDASVKRAFSALATVSVLTVTLFGIVALTGVPVSAPYVTTQSIRVELTPNSGTSGNVGDTMTFAVKATNVEQTRWEGPLPSGMIPEGSGSEGPAGGVSGTVSFSGPSGSESASFVTDSSGKASVTHAFSQAGTYTVQAHVSGFESNGVTVSIAAEPTTPASPTPNNAGGGNGSGSGSDGGADIASQAGEGIADIAAQAEAATGLGSNWLLIVLAVIIIVILAIIATALLMRRRD